LVSDVWRGQSGERFAQLSAFFPESSVFNEESVLRLRHELNNSLRNSSIEATGGRKLHTDAWSANVDVTLISEHETNPVSAKAIAVGGDFFLFHPLKLRDGSYLSPNDVMKDRIVIDEELAWRLFGAIRLAGFEVLINDKIFIVAGVVSRENDFASSIAYTYGAGLFMSFEAYSELYEGNASISTYEIVMPDPITGFALSEFTDVLAYPSAIIIENSARFSLGKIFEILGSFGERSMQRDPIAFPYWENAARFAEDRLALLLVFTIILIIFPVVCAVIYTVILVKFGVRQLIKYIKKQIDIRDKKHYEQYKLDHGDKPQIYSVDDILRDAQDEIY